MIVRSCVRKRTTTAAPCPLSSCSRSSHAIGPRPFHHTSSPRAEVLNHYATLGVPPDASAAQIKKQFYQLSKSHHPDLHPNDPTAAQTFVRISEAYATLGAADKRARYDRDVYPQFGGSGSSGGGSGSAPRGSYSSASAAAGNGAGPGGRPASGLSRRRTAFRGPPPSFYRSGGWGAHADKRGEAAAKGAWGPGAAAGSAGTGRREGDAGEGAREPGMGPAGFTKGFDNDVRHFDQQAHAQTHSGIERTRHRARRTRTAPVEEAEAGSGGGVLFNFVLITGMLGVIYGATRLVMGAVGSTTGTEGGKKKVAEGESG